jgi:hypothetical protein
MTDTEATKSTAGGMQHPEVTHVVYLDDEDGEYDGSDRLIQTFADTGLTDAIATRVIRYLNESDISDF